MTSRDTDPKPLGDLRIIAVEQYGAGPFGTQYLADLGAEVIKIEDPRTGGDVSRGIGPFFAGGADPTRASLFFQAFNREKRSLTLDLKSEEGREIFARLVRTADAVAENLRGDVPEKLGLTYKHLGGIKPDIVCAHLSAYGREGARAAWPGYDYLMQAEAGYFAVTGEPGGPPARMGLSIVDYMAGITMALALLAGVHQARQSGRGRDFDVSLYDTALFNLAYLSTWYLNAGHNQGRDPRSAHPSLTPCQLYKTSDGWIYLMCNKEKFYANLCEKIARPDLVSDPRFEGYENRLKNREALTILLDEALSKKPTSEWLGIFAESVPAAPLLDVAQALESPFLHESGRVISLALGENETLKALRSPIRVSGKTIPQNPAGGPALGADTDALLEELGYGRDERKKFGEKGII